jgi:hypothetical protein
LVGSDLFFELGYDYEGYEGDEMNFSLTFEEIGSAKETAQVHLEIQ